MDNFKICTQTFETAPVEISKEAAGLSDKFGESGRTLRVHFLDGDPSVKTKVEKYAHVWEEYASIIFNFVDDPTAEIRITFEGNESKSMVGKDCLKAKEGQPTMWFGWLTPETDEIEYSRTVLHEFGHALGLIHEHQHPESKIPWDEEAVYKYFEKKGWKREYTKEHVLKRYSILETNYSEFDKDSIMIYAIPNELTDGDYEVNWNTQLSEMDKEFIGKMYTTEEQLEQVAEFATRFRAVNGYAGNNGFGAAFPNFHQADHQDGRGVVYGVVCIKPEAVEQRSVPMYRLVPR